MHFESHLSGIRGSLRKIEKSIRRPIKKTLYKTGIKKAERSIRKVIPKEIRKAGKILLPFEAAKRFSLIGGARAALRARGKGAPGSALRRRYHKRLGIIQKVTGASAGIAAGIAAAPYVSAKASAAVSAAAGKAKKLAEKLQKISKQDQPIEAPAPQQSQTPTWIPYAAIAAMLLMGN